MADRQHDRSSLLLAKLRSLLGDRVPSDAASVDFPAGAALVGGGVAWVLLESAPVSSLGAAMVLVARHGASELHVVVDEPGAAGVVARRAACFAPAPQVWVVDGAELVPATASPVPVEAPVPPAPELAELLVDADVEVLVEDGIVRGEVLGLEVARIVHGTSTAGVPLEEPLLEVGVGQADRELTAMLHGELAPREQLARVIEIVRSHRRPGAAPHPLNELVPERWLRARLLAEPARIGLRELHPAAPAVPRASLRDRGIAVATGVADDGTPAVVACSVGIDLDLVPAAADARLALDPDAPLLVVVPERDAHPVTRDLVERLTAPARLVALPGDWRA